MCHWPGPRSLATTNGVSVDVLSSRYLDVSVPWVRLKPPMNSEVSYLRLIRPIFSDVSFLLTKVGCPIRRSSDQSLFAAPRGLSQRTTSFIASQRQGIHRTPFLALDHSHDRCPLPLRQRIDQKDHLFACRTHPINGAVTPSLVVGPFWGPNSRTCSPLHDVKYCLLRVAQRCGGWINLGQDERETETAASRQEPDRF